MLIKLTPDQVIKEWKVIKHAIQEATHEQIFDTDNKVQEHLREILIGTMQVWGIVEEGVFAGIGVSRFSHDNTMGVRRLEIYSVYGFRTISAGCWAENFVVLKRFAAANNCDYIITLTDNENIIAMAKEYGADTEQRLIAFKIQEDLSWEAEAQEVVVQLQNIQLI